MKTSPWPLTEQTIRWTRASPGHRLVQHCSFLQADYETKVSVRMHRISHQQTNSNERTCHFHDGTEALQIEQLPAVVEMNKSCSVHAVFLGLIRWKHKQSLCGRGHRLWGPQHWSGTQETCICIPGFLWPWASHFTSLFLLLPPCLVHLQHKVWAVITKCSYSSQYNGALIKIKAVGAAVLWRVLFNSNSQQWR